MKSILFVAAIFLAGGIAGLSAGEDYVPATDPIRTSATGADSDAITADNLRVQRVGVEGACILSRNSIQEVQAEACAAVYAPLAGVSGWSEDSDGSVILNDRNGNAVVVLGLADGHAYESVIPVAAMLIVEPAVSSQ